jgi:hypothetical protein
MEGSLKHHLNRRLTPRQAAVVIIIVAVLGGAGYASYEFIAARIFESRMRAVMPGLCAGIRQQRAVLVSAIEAYKASFGEYPPDHVLSRQPLVVDPVTNTLLYELAGAICDATNKMFSMGGLEPAEAAYVKEFFHIAGFRNCGQSADQVKHFLPAENLPVRQLHDDPDVFVLSAPVPFDQVDPEVVWKIDRGAWRYVSSAPTNNPGHFDLWIEVRAGDQKITIGNWKAVE